MLLDPGNLEVFMQGIWFEQNCTGANLVCQRTVNLLQMLVCANSGRTTGMVDYWTGH